MERKPLLEVLNVSKQFRGNFALRDVSLCAYGGEVQGLLGVNGAGKSTLMNILAGVLTPDDGRILIGGAEANILSPKAADDLGIAFIHQEAVLFGNLTVAENMYLSRFPKLSKGAFIDTRRLHEQSAVFLEMLGGGIRPETKACDLSIGQKQLVAIARALSKGANILLFDEPTSSLSYKEKDRLFQVMRSLKERGVTMFFISHFLDEVKEICDRVTVLRDGTVSGAGPIDDFTQSDLVRLVIGKDVGATVRRSERTPGEAMLEVKGLSRAPQVRNVSFRLREKEVVGLWGLMGSGRTELVRALLGLDPCDGGELLLRRFGRMERVGAKQLYDAYCGYVTENRHEDGLFLMEPLWRNGSAASLPQYATKWLKFLQTDRERSAMESLMERLNIAGPGIDAKAEQLSGGNQQKVVLAKWVQKRPKLLILDEPTRGVDVGAKSEIHKWISEYADQGASVLLISSEIEEILTLSDRVLVLNRGRIVGDFEGAEIKRDALMKLSLVEDGEA